VLFEVIRLDLKFAMEDNKSGHKIMSRAIEGKATNPQKKAEREAFASPVNDDLNQTKRDPDIKEWVYRPQVSSRE
jgi:hypothetical protein